MSSKSRLTAAWVDEAQSNTEIILNKRVMLFSIFWVDVSRDALNLFFGFFYWKFTSIYVRNKLVMDDTFSQKSYLLYWRRCCGVLHTWVGKQCKHLFFGKPCLFVSILLESLLAIFSCSNRIMQCNFLAQGFTVFKRLVFVFFWIIKIPTNQHSGGGEIDVNRKHLGRNVSCTLRLWLFFFVCWTF